MAGISEFTHNFFEESSKAWRANKIPYAEGMFRYKDLPVEKAQTSRKNTQERRKREKIDEFAPLRVRRSSRLRLKQIEDLYS